MARSKKLLNKDFFRKYSIPLCAVLFFFAVCWSATSTIKGMTVLALILTFLGGIVWFPRLRDRVSLPLIPLALFVAVCGISTSYALSGKFALYEFLKLLLAFCFAIFMLAAVPGEGAAPGRKIASILEGCLALTSVVSIDHLSTHFISTPVLSILGSISTDYAPSMEGVQVDTRMLTIFGNPNVFATCAGICMLLSLGLIFSSESRKERTIHLICLFINALAFLLAFSMGATAFIAVAFLLYLILERKEHLASAFFLMASVLLVVFAATLAIYMTSFGVWSGFQPVPMLCVVIGSAAVCLMDKFVVQPLGSKLASHNKLVGGIIAGFLVAVIAYAFVAYQLTGPITIEPDTYLIRAVDLAPGDYTVTAQTSGPVHAIVYYQTEHDIMMDNLNYIYYGPLSDAAFTVPEGSLAVHFFLETEAATTLETLECVGPESYSVPLGYKLLPGFIANRLQNLWANQSAIQRLVFFEDGMKMFQRSPVAGLGLGSFENAIRNVQTFFYETKYAHNHYIQTMAETGLIGLFLLVSVFVSCAVAVLFERKKGEDAHPLAPALGAAVVYIACHVCMEVSFSYFASLPFIMCTFALVILCCGSAIPVPRLTQKVKAGVLIACAALIAVFSVFFSQNLSAAALTSSQPSMESLSKAAKMDKFEYADYMLSYVVNSSKYPDDMLIQDTALEYVEQLSELSSNTVPYYLAEYYFSRGQLETGFDMLEKYLRYVVSDSEAWNNAFNLLIRYADFNDDFTAGLNRIVDIFRDWNENNIGDIELNDSSLQLLNLFGIELDQTSVS